MSKETQLESSRVGIQLNLFLKSRVLPLCSAELHELRKGFGIRAVSVLEGQAWEGSMTGRRRPCF